MDDLISVVVTVYNNEKYLKDCILSIISQTYRNMEIIIIDDGSTDGSSKICDELLIANSRLKVFHQVHCGLASARNKGIEMASGEFITFVNGCDYIKSNILEKLFSMMNTYMVDISMCSTYSEDTGIKSSSDQMITFDKEDAIRQLLIEKIIKNNPYAKLFNREIFKNIGFQDDGANNIYNFFEQSTKIAFMNTQLYLMREDDSFSLNSNLTKDLTLSKKYPELQIYCKCNIIKSIQNEFYNDLTNNVPIINEDQLYSMFVQIVKENDSDISPFLSYVRKAHMYLLANSKSNYRILCPVLPDINE